MAKISVVVLADTEAHGELARVLNAMELVKEAAGAGDETELVFDGAGVNWVPELSNPEHKLHQVFKDVKPQIAGACEFCANAFEVKNDIQKAQIRLLSEFDGHPSLRRRVAEGYQVITF